MIIITGGAGFIGSNLVKRFNKLYPNEEIFLIENFIHSESYKNLLNLEFADIINLEKVENFLKKNNSKIKVIFHQGAISDTKFIDFNKIMKLNYEFSKLLLNFSIKNEIKYIYASSASVYGKQNSNHQYPLNLYAYTKYLFDKYVEKNIKNINNNIIGLRYFNVYGSNEEHKQNMSSMPYQMIKQIKNSNKISLFKGHDGYKNGEQVRDFIHVDNCVDVNMYFFENNLSGIYDVGTTKPLSFNSIANSIINKHGSGNINYIDMPKSLADKYQNYTCSKKEPFHNKIKFYTFNEKINEMYLDIK